jgi:hypothetical protein
VAYQVFETSVFNRKLHAEARMLFVPRDVAAELDVVGVAGTQSEVLGVRLGVPIPDEQGVVDVLYASLQGRPVTFDLESFDRWRPRWQQERSEESLFAQELAFGERAPVANSPLRLDSVASLATRGQAFVTDGAEWTLHHPLHALGVFVLVEGALLFVALKRVFRRTIVDAAEYHLRRELGLPDDWIPPRDR